MDHRSIEVLIKGFEAGTWPAAEWTHQSHIYMALWYLSKSPPEEASIQIKQGIRLYNERQGGENTPTSGYHETITEFYIRILSSYISRTNFSGEDASWQWLQNEPFMDKEFPLTYYSETYLMTPLARATWCDPDLQPISAYEKTLPA